MGRIVGAYFSPTGGTRRALEEICGLLDAPWDRLELAGPEKGSCALGREDLLVLALPVYAGQRPAVPGLLDGLAGEETPCLLVATYGNRHYDDALAQMRRELGERGFRCVGAAAAGLPRRRGWSGPRTAPPRCGTPWTRPEQGPAGILS